MRYLRLGAERHFLRTASSRSADTRIPSYYIDEREAASSRRRTVCWISRLGGRHGRARGAHRLQSKYRTWKRARRTLKGTTGVHALASDRDAHPHAICSRTFRHRYGEHRRNAARPRRKPGRAVTFRTRTRGSVGARSPPALEGRVTARYGLWAGPGKQMRPIVVLPQ